MRICMISGNSGSGGGLENVVNRLSKELMDHEIHITIYNSGSVDTVSNSPNCCVETLAPYNILPNSLQFANYYQYAYSLKVLKRLKSSKPFDIIHGHGDNCFFPMLFRDSTPIITNIHGVKKAYRERVFGPNSKYVKGPRLMPLFWPEEIATKRSDLTVACSKAERDDLISIYGANPNKIVIIYNGVDTHIFKPMDKLAARKILGLQENKNYAIWVGNNPQLKGLKLAIEAVREIKNLTLLVVGASGVNFRNVLFFGMVYDILKLSALYNSADFLIFPTLYEGFPLVPLEAMACGLPIIISRECPTREIITDGVEGFVINQRKPELYAEKINQLIKTNYLNSETSLACRKLAEGFNWSKVAQQYIKLYQKYV